MSNSNDKFYFAKSVSDKDGFLQITIPPGAFEIESLNNEIKRILMEKEHFTEAIYHFTMKPDFSTLGHRKFQSRIIDLFST